MSKEETTVGNPEIGMTEDSFESAEASNPGSEEFFSALENDVNGSIVDPNEATHEDVGPEMAYEPEVTQDMSESGSNNVEQSEGSQDWKKRYQDSSREAVKLKEQMNELTPFVPVLDAMRNDSGLVDHVREYLVNGGKPAKSIKEQLNLDEDFIFDANEAMSDSESDSAKLMNAHVDGLVKNRVSSIVKAEKQNAAAYQAEVAKKQEEQAFREKHNMTDEEYADFVDRAKNHILTLEDVNYLINRDKVATNTANATRADMLNQMKNVRDIPASASGANSQGAKNDPDSDIFDGLLDLDGGVDNLFG
tara:strand:+ start:32 stop:949 length:918 start_codon:yes stop_codon:yes gene_type:complete